ncbi:MAG: alkaline phosphatase family protein [Bacteroidales bacterium]|nr:alkaline phosphatase family protein [Bacteroidales bacterium]
MKNFFIVFCCVLMCLNTKAQQKNPPLIVGIVVQQMRYDAIARYASEMTSNGFLRIFRSGAVCNNACYDYMITEPSPGFATIYTGANPCSHGIIADSWYDRNSGKYVSSTGDTKYSAVGAVSETGKVSPLKLSGTTLGDQLKLSNYKRSKVFSVSYNNYGAVLPSGRLSNGAYWFDEKSGCFISSSYYMKTLPSWVSDFNSRRLPEDYLEKGWHTLKTMGSYEASLPDNSIYENGINGQNVFPYSLLKHNEGGYKALKHTPFVDELTKEFVLDLIDKEDLGGDNFTDLLMINFASAGNVSDLFGIRSVELEDTYLRLDNYIAQILQRLDQKLGTSNYIVFLTADRGSSDTPSFLQDMGLEGQTIDVKHFMTLLNAYLRALYGDEKWVDKYYGRQIYLNHLAIERHKLSLKEVQDMASQFLLEIDGISNAVPSSVLLGGNTGGGVWKQAVNNFYRKRSGDIIINLEPHSIEVGEGASRSGFSNSAQNSAYNYDVHVPLAFFGRNIKSVKVNRKVSIADITPTLTTILQILPPDRSTGEAIHEVIYE